jgi:hypothetical protein
MRKNSIRITCDPATIHSIEELARLESRSTAGATPYLVKLGLAAKRAEQRPAADRTEQPSS